MRLLFVADGRSPIALNWMRYFVDHGDEVHLASTYPCESNLPLKSFKVIPVAFSASRRGANQRAGRPYLSLRLRTALRHWLGPFTISRAARHLRAYSKDIQPELVHAMRIPFEGMLAADAYSQAPLLVSVWGNDFTLHAPTTPLMRHYTSWTMQVADALHADCARDLRLARQWGLDSRKPALVMPGAGGIQPSIFFPATTLPSRPVVINARGARAYVRNDVFLRAFSIVHARRPDARAICVALEGDSEAARLVGLLDLGGAVDLLPQLTQPQLAESMRRAPVMVSPSTHDGTPNSLLEGMACGCFPIAGNLESIREWITDRLNGLLVDPTNPDQLASAILMALEDEDLRHRAAGLNLQMIKQRADYERCMPGARAFYTRVIANTNRPTRAP